jgi:hypothetical protein
MNSQASNFCSKCGRPLGENEQMKQLISAELKDQLKELLKSEYSDARFIEVTTSQAIAERLYSWAKLFGAVVAIPLAITVFLFGVAGFHTYSDFASFGSILF